jgi:signal transduction histidine kinase
MAEGEQYLKWRVDVNTFRLLGRELITDRVTAIFELVKNCYDANASKVDIRISNASTISSKSRIVIKDNGDGMTFSDVQDKWMVVGTNSKRANQYSGPPYNRKLVGEKGVGRFAVEKLGSGLLLRSKKKSDNQSVCVEIDWSAYESISANHDSDKQTQDGIALIPKEDVKEKEDKLYFTDIKNRYWYENAAKSKKGTELHISGLREVWTESDIVRLERELSRLVSPLDNRLVKFIINIIAPEFDKYKKLVKVENKLFEQSAYKIDLRFDEKSGTQDVIKFNKTELQTEKRKIFPMGPVRMVLYYFDSEAKKKFKAAFAGDGPDGIKVYRDGLIATPFAETTSDENKKRDILGIDKRKYNAFFEKVGNRDLLGIVEITKRLNPAIIDSTSRQDFVDNEAYAELKHFIFDQIVQIEKYLKYKRSVEKAKASSSMASAKNELNTFTQAVRRIASETPALTIKLKPLLEASQRIKVDFDKGVKAYNRLQKDKERQENLFMSLMSLQEYAAQMAHVVRIAISRVLHLAEFFKEYFPNPQFDSEFKEYSQQLYGEMLSLNNVINYMLSYALADTEKVEINIATTLQDLLCVRYAELFKKENIHSSFEINQSVVIVANPRFFLDIFENMVANSIKALNGFSNKLIKCSVTVDKNRVVVLFSDNGVGIPVQNRERIFDVYFTTTAEQGGAGLGLFVVKSRVEALKGTVEVVDSEFGSRGATFKIDLPFDN